MKQLKYVQLFEDRLESLKKLLQLGLVDDATAALLKAIDWMEAGSVGSLDLSESDIGSLPDGLQVEGSLFLRGCTRLVSLPAGLEVGRSLYLEGCTGLTSLPDGLEVGHSLYLDNCLRLRRLPNGLKVGHTLWLRGSGIFDLPEDLVVGQSIIK